MKSSSMAFRVFLLAVLLLASPFLSGVRCQADSEADLDDVVADVIKGHEEAETVDEDIPDFRSWASAPGVDTVCIFPKNFAKLILAGEESEVLVGLKNEGESKLTVIALRASLHLPFDHNLLVQNLTVQQFYNGSVPVSAQATFPYLFSVSKYLQPGTFDLVGTIMYEINQKPYQSTFYNGTVEVVEAGGLLSIESVFLICLGLGLLALSGLWVYGQIQNFSKKTKRAPKVEVGTGTRDASMDEWLEGTAYAQSSKATKKKK
ncbi:hypothetical protein C5167_010353 [Papaver somniferum]|uniref:Translocon-associated protein subunit alpha n=1 Tax=Papaver somniferum TaxID=3469 RepID=A0A4Y7K009_PAPSO|nr:translocon-associated protein subunit alpha-like [Papaver somniferum]RZC66663.1 hypothetical protein C5167_010353 [Papaver somniferum]